MQTGEYDLALADFRHDPIFKDLVIQKRIEYDSLRVIYGGTEFFDVENSKQ